MPTRTVRWVGHPAPLQSPAITDLLLRGRMPDGFRAALARFENNYRTCPQFGHSICTANPDGGFSRSYQWGPQIFDQDMDEEDYQLLMAHPLNRTMFQDVTDGSFWPVQVLSGAEWEELMRVFAATPSPQISKTFLG